MQTKIQNILKRLLQLHPKSVDLSLNRIKRLLKNLNNPQNKIKNAIQVIGTNGKHSVCSTLREIFETAGYNLEGSEIGAAFGLVQLGKLDEYIRIRQENFLRQCQFFAGHSKYFYCPIETPNVSTAWLAFPILIRKDAPFNRKELQIFLEKNKCIF